MNCSRSESVGVFLAALHPERQGWAYAVGDRDGFRRPLWIDLSKSNAGQRLRRFAIDQGGARVSVSSYRDQSSRSARNVRSCRWVMVDQDGERRPIPETIPPTLSVYSGGQTGFYRHRHLLWRVDDLDYREVGKINRDQAQLVGGDQNFTAGATATVRVPLEPDDLTLTAASYRALDLRRHHAPTPRRDTYTPAADRTTTDDLGAATALAIADAVAGVDQGASRNVTGWELAGRLRELGLSEAATIETGRQFVSAVEKAKPNDHPYELSEWTRQVERRFASGAAVVDPELVERVDRWESGNLADPDNSSSQKTVVSAVAGIVRATGKERFTLSERELAERSRLSRPAVRRALKGTKARGGLIGKALRTDGRWRKGNQGANRFELVDPPPSPPTTATTFSVDWERLDPPSISPTIPPNHDAWSHLGIGHGARLVFDALASLDSGATAHELTRSASLSNYPSTIRKQLKRLASHGLAERLPDGRWVARIDSLTDALDAAAEATGTVGYGHRLQLRHAAERLAYAETMQRYADPDRHAAYRASRLRRIKTSPERRRGSEQAPPPKQPRTATRRTSGHERRRTRRVVAAGTDPLRRRQISVPKRAAA